jgi:two-component system LytT family sensor kinase
MQYNQFTPQLKHLAKPCRLSKPNFLSWHAMGEPTILQYISMTACCLVLAMIGLYLLANFRTLFRGSIHNEILRRNLAVWIVMLFLSSAMAPMSGGFFQILHKYGWCWAVAAQFISSLAHTLFVFNTAWLVAENRRLKKLTFIQHKVIVFATIVIMTVAVNIPLFLLANAYSTKNIEYIIISSIYLGGAIGLVYIITNYLDIERKRKFDEKELELSRLRELKSKAELDALHSKVNPHFLYNALNSIADLSITDGRKARSMTIALADLFRYSINYSQDNFSTIRDEVAMTEVYLQIEKIRFEDQLTYSVNIDPEMAHYLVPRFLLQPLVENAVKHGLKITGKMTEIRLEIKKDNDAVNIDVFDNGPLFPEELTPGYGVKSVFDKLDLLFPGQYEIHFVNVPVKKVSIKISKLIKNDPGF